MAREIPGIAPTSASVAAAFAMGNGSTGRRRHYLSMPSDRVVTPGFIDVHSHAAEGLNRAELRQGQPLLAQGITTIVGEP